MKEGRREVGREEVTVAQIHQSELSGNLGGRGELLEYGYTDGLFLEMSYKWKHAIRGLFTSIMISRFFH